MPSNTNRVPKEIAGTVKVDGITAIRRRGVNYFDYQGAAAYLDSSKSTINNMVWSGKLRPIRLGRRKIIDQGQLDRVAGFDSDT